MCYFYTKGQYVSNVTMGKSIGISAYYITRF